LGSALIGIPAVVVFCEVVAALVSRRREVSDAPRVPAAILIPAHDEEAVLGETLASVTAQMGEGDRVLVVADNCSDRTADIAREHGVEVIERTHDTDRGKGFALAYGSDHLAESPPELLVIVDADCRLGEGALDRLIRRCSELGRPVQSDYQLRPAEPSARTAVSGLAILLRNKVRPLGLRELGLGCQLTGSGMAIPWSQWRGISGLDDFLAEDLLLGVELTKAGAPPYFEDEAQVRSVLPVEGGGQQTQRTRWEQGQLTMLLVHGPKLLLEGIVRLDRYRVGAALDLLVPPLAAWVMLAVVWWAFAMLVGLVTWRFEAATSVFSALVGMGVAVFLAWARFGRDDIPFGHLAAIPAYVVWKIPMYAKILFRRTTGWNKTKRDA
jgi:cellulose synthase/poly-beta-1,6-N-acetylglucosamine synthase-like glycosyltransferase